MTKLPWPVVIAATMTFGWCFAVWTWYAAAGLLLQDQWQLSGTELGLLLASPILSGALLRLPAGILADRICPRQLWQILLLLQTPPLFLLSYVETFTGYLFCGLWLGISGVSFTLGTRYLTLLVTPQKAGFVLGIFGIGNAGAAVSLFVASLVADQIALLLDAGFYLGWLNLLVLCLFSWFCPPVNSQNQAKTLHPQPIAVDVDVDVDVETIRPDWRDLLSDSRLWRFSLYYYFVFGCFLALLLWLPHYYMTAYQLPMAQALSFTLFFVATSSMVRGLGGYLAQRFGSRTINWSVFWICLCCLFFLSYPPTDLVIRGIDKQVALHIEINVWLFTALLFVVGIAQGLGRASVYSLLYRYYPQRFGAASGMVSAIAATGGFTLPILFGLSQDLLGIYSGCFMLLYGVLALCMILMFFANQREQFQLALAKARADNFLADDH